ncbi:hypothetical protein J3459_006698 [Metarhizium acridum]|uniref:uncharacterized protein n=1 Tax=Metarhizium acridum TaxID=92637 RepID=UPI001C6AE2EC|nr:hypothetical protein J3458_004919 [Metarhizium acridum]KAG8427433.1 hypothetical protein J3459_006698 [Metarhizium acridum]
MDLHHACGGRWDTLVTQCHLTTEELDSFLEYAGMFLCNLGNSYSKHCERLQIFSQMTMDGLENTIGPLLAVPPFSLGCPSRDVQSAHYPGTEALSQEEIAQVSASVGRHSLWPENTRLRKLFKNGKPVYRLLQASAETDASSSNPHQLDNDLFLMKGDHSQELSKVCSALKRAKAYASNSKKIQFLEHYIESFRTGSLEAFQASQKVWVTMSQQQWNT